MSALHVNVLGSTGAGGRLLVLVHGYGADEHDLAPLAPLVDPDGRFFAICPRAPLDLVPFGAGWYERGPDGSIDPSAFLGAVDALDRTVDDACAAHGLRREDAVVIGFSQGGAMTMAANLRRGATRPAAIACLSGMMQDVDGLDYDLTGALPTILVQHGLHDPLVPIERGHRTRDRLDAAGVEHTYREYPMQHEINARSLADLAGWLSEQ